LTVSRFTLAERRLTALAESHALDEHQRAQLAIIIDELASDPHAPSAVREPPEAVEIHIADSLAALDVVQVSAARELVDIGSGAGFPGLPLAVALPDSRMRLLESRARKCAFLKRVVRQARIANAEAVCSRAEEWATGLGGSDVVLARALAPQPVVLEYAAPLLRPGGVVVDWRGRLDRASTRAAAQAAEELGLAALEARRAEPFPGAFDHWLYLYLKVRATPERFPRRPGVARKRPLA
jgi:16S rRNA (guanine527-N7)-methyltransferase